MGLQRICLEGIGKEGLEHGLRGQALDYSGGEAVRLEPGFLQQARP